MRHAFEHGVDKADRTGTGTRSVFGQQMRFDLFLRLIGRRITARRGDWHDGSARPGR